MNNLENLINKKVLITGNTGFKGAWLSILLDELGVIKNKYNNLMI